MMIQKGEKSVKHLKKKSKNLEENEEKLEISDE